MMAKTDLRNMAGSRRVEKDLRVWGGEEERCISGTTLNSIHSTDAENQKTLRALGFILYRQRPTRLALSVGER